MTAHAPSAPVAGPDALRRPAADRTRLVDWYGLSESNLPESVPVRPADQQPAAAPGRLAAAGRAIGKLARRIGRAIVQARMAQAKRLIALEGWRAGDAGSHRPLDADRFNSRYY